jgi:diguanylate cyclase (GGDEF)-like protein
MGTVMHKPLKRTRPLVLVVDWNDDENGLGLETLKTLGAEVISLKHAIQALGMFQEIAPDVVILNATEPEMDRFAVCKSIQNINKNVQSHVLVVSESDDATSIGRAFEAGANDFVPSPIDWAILGHRLGFLWRERCLAKAIKAGKRRYRQFVNALPDILVRLDQEGIILDLEGPSDSEVTQLIRTSVGQSLQDALLLDRSDPQTCAFENAMKERSQKALSHELHLGSRAYACDILLVPSGSEEVVAIVRDVTEQKMNEERILQLACLDLLTGFQTRHAFKEHLSGTMAQAKRDGRLLALLFLDLNRFQRINETLGHSAGDLLLRMMAERIIHCTRKGDTRAQLQHTKPLKALARFGADQFAVLLERIEHARDASNVARRILDAMAHPFMIADSEVFMTACVGIAVFPGDGGDAESLLTNAHKAMQDAKEEGKNTFRFFTPSTNAQACSELSLESSLRKALDCGELFLVYQPQVDLKSGRIVGVEALLRWDHPELGLVSPVQFIPIAERTGLIVPIGEWVLGVACLQSRIWQKTGLPPVRMAVNLSAHQFRQKNLVDVIRKTLTKSSLDPSLLDLEITEGTAMHKADSAIHILKALKEIGVKLSIDDFGTGYSSLSYLKHFPLDVLKIDRSFVKDVEVSPDSVAIVRAIIAMAKSLNFAVIAEGVETEQQLEFLKVNGCDAMQGYYFSPPVPAREMTRLLEAKRCLA